MKSWKEPIRYGSFALNLNLFPWKTRFDIAIAILFRRPYELGLKTPIQQKKGPLIDMVIL